MPLDYDIFHFPSLGFFFVIGIKLEFKSLVKFRNQAKHLKPDTCLKKAVPQDGTFNR